MVNDRLVPAEATLGARWNRFWFAAASPWQLHRLRIAGGLLILAWMLSFLGHQDALLSLRGWFDYQAYVEVNPPDRPPVSPVPIGWSIFYLSAGNRALFDAMYWGSILVATLFTLGLATRITGVLTWVAVVSFLANPAISYDADFLMSVLAFYLMAGYLLLGFWNGRLSPLECVLGPNDAFLFSRWLGGGSAPKSSHSYTANVIMRLFQVHFAIIVVTSGLHKLQIADWWAGVALWYPMHAPFQTTADMLMREKGTAPLTLGVLGLVQYLALAWQLTFPLFAWRGGWWRVVLLGGAVAGWIGSALIMGLPWFGPFYLVGCLSYLQDEEWQRGRGLLSGRRAAATKQPTLRTRERVTS